MDINTGDTAWMLVATALVMLMTPGLALFYGGMVQRKNVLSTFMHSFMALGIVTVAWAVIGYSLAFGKSIGGVIGGLDYAFLSNVGMEKSPSGAAIPHVVFMMYQMMFAIITPALISGAYAERMKFSTFAVFTLAWSILVYSPLAHWVWNPEGWLFKLGALDFAGGTVVHLSSGLSALVVALFLGKRTGYPQVRHAPHNVTLTLIGAGLLWFGWFGFNAGSAVASNGLAGIALANTHIAAAVGALAWCAVDQIRVQKMTALGAASGLVAGLVAITPAAGFVSPMAAMAIGAAAGVICYAGVMLKGKLGYDDALDAFGVHGVGGALGAILTGVLAKAAFVPGLSPEQAAAWSFGDNLKLAGKQLVAVGAAGAYAALVTAIVLVALKATMGLRVTKDEEIEGLDVTLHGESGYELGSTTTSPALADEEGELAASAASTVGSLVLDR